MGKEARGCIGMLVREAMWSTQEIPYELEIIYGCAVPGDAVQFLENSWEGGGQHRSERCSRCMRCYISG